MSLKHGLLGLLNYEPMTGYELDKLFNESLGYFWQAKGSQIYRELDAMEQSGWLTSERVIQDEKPNKRVYSITDNGKAEFMDWLLSPEADIEKSMQVRNAFLMRVFFAGETGKGLALKLLHSYREVCFVRIKEIDEVMAMSDEEMSAGGGYEYALIYWRLTALFGEIISKARLEWVEKAITILENEKGDN